MSGNENYMQMLNEAFGLELDPALHVLFLGKIKGYVICL